ncbi:hypothetical protein HDV63DRAFT_154620 [Trichoderma sp. SZMC 28014]
MAIANLLAIKGFCDTHQILMIDCQLHLRMIPRIASLCDVVVGRRKMLLLHLSLSLPLLLSPALHTICVNAARPGSVMQRAEALRMTPLARSKVRFQGTSLLLRIAGVPKTLLTASRPEWDSVLERTLTSSRHCFALLVSVTCMQPRPMSPLSSSHASSSSRWRKRLQFTSHRGSDQQANTRPEMCHWQHSMNGGSSSQTIYGQATISQERPE